MSDKENDVEEHTINEETRDEGSTYEGSREEICEENEDLEQLSIGDTDGDKIEDKSDNALEDSSDHSNDKITPDNESTDDSTHLTEQGEDKSEPAEIIDDVHTEEIIDHQNEDKEVKESLNMDDNESLVIESHESVENNSSVCEGVGNNEDDRVDSKEDEPPLGNSDKGNDSDNERDNEDEDTSEVITVTLDSEVLSSISESDYEDDKVPERMNVKVNRSFSGNESSVEAEKITKVAPILVSTVHENHNPETTEKLLERLKNTSDKEETKLLCTEFVKISQTGFGKEILGNNIHLFVDILKDNDNSTKVLALKIINNLGTVENSKEEFRKAGGFSVIIQLYDSELELQTLALNAIGYLITRDLENARELKKVGGIPQLIKFLGHESTRIKFFAAACAWVLAAYQNEFQDILLESGAVPLLLDLINGHEDIAWQAAGALRNIVIKDDRVHQAIIDSAGLSKYKQALSLDSKLSERVIGLITQTFLIISTNDAIKDAVRDQNMFPILFDRLKQLDTPIEFRSRILFSLTNLCTKNQKNQEQCRKEGGIQLLLSMINSEKTPESLRSDASTTLWACTNKNQENINILCEDENFAILQQSLVMETEKVLVGIVATFGNIASFSPQTKTLLREKGVVPLILDFLRGNHATLLETTAAAIISLIRDNDENIIHLMEWDGPLLLAKNINSNNEGVQKNILGALKILLENQYAKTFKAILNANAIEVIINLLSSESSQLQLNAAGCLCIMAEHSSKVRSDLNDLHAEQSFRKALDGNSTKLKSLVCDLIQYTASENESFRSALGKKDIHIVLIEIIKSKSVEILLLEKSIKALWAVCISNALHQQIARENGGIDALLSLLMAKNARIRTKSAVLKALAAICSKNFKNQEVVRLHDGAIPKIIESLAVGESVKELGEQAALCIWCLCVGNQKMKVTVKTENGIIALVELIHNNTTDPGIVLNTLGAIISLATKSNSNKLAIKEAGIVNVVNGIDLDNDYISSQIKEVISLMS